MTTHTHTYQKRFWLIFFVLVICNTAFAIDVEYIVTIDNCYVPDSLTSGGLI